MIVSDYKSRNNNKIQYKSLFINTKEINTPLGKEYNILHYISPKLKNENKVFDLIHNLFDKKEFLKLKQAYDSEKKKINKQIITHRNKKEKSIKFNSVNINSFDKSKMKLDLPHLTIEDNFMIKIIQFSNKKKKLLNKKVLDKKKKKYLNLKYCLSQNDMHIKYTTENTNKNTIYKITNKNPLVNNFISNENIKNENLTKQDNNNKTQNTLNSYNDLNNYKSLSSFSSNSIQNNNNKHKNIIIGTRSPSKTANLFHSKNKLNINKKCFSCTDFLFKQKNMNSDSKKIISSNILNSNKNEESLNENTNDNNKYNFSCNKNLDYNKAFNEIYSSFFEGENQLLKDTKEINNNLLEIKYKKYFNNIDIYNNVVKSISKKRKKKNRVNKLKKNYKKISENLARYKRGLYDYPEVNEYIYGSRNPIKVFGGFRNPYKIKHNYFKNIFK